MLVLLSVVLSAQSTEQADTSSRNVIFPVLFFLPETSLGFGGTWIHTTLNERYTADTRPSQVLVSAVYTLRNQWLFFVPYEFYGNNNSWRIKGELGYYRFFYNFFGLGPDSQQSDLETYSVNFPRVDFNYSYRIGESFFLGGGFNFDQFDITEVQSEGILERTEIVGNQGGTKFNLYGIAIIDTRDNVFSTYDGFYGELVYQQSVSGVSTFDYNKFSVDLRYFKSFDALTIGSNVRFIEASDEAPFFDLPYVSSPMISRGFDDRRYISHGLITAQTELRYAFSRRWIGAAFISSSWLREAQQSYSGNAKIAYGLGVRYEIDRERHTRFRLDWGFGEGQSNIYLTVNEAF
jgi:hypothetical protein